jgi:hypothetical protein
VITRSHSTTLDYSSIVDSVGCMHDCGGSWLRRPVVPERWSASRPQYSIRLSDSAAARYMSERGPRVCITSYWALG